MRFLVVALAFLAASSALAQTWPAKHGFDTIADFAPFTGIGNATLLIAHPSVPASTSKSWRVALAYGTSGAWQHATSHRRAAQAAPGSGNDAHPHKGGGQAIGDLIGGALPLL